MSSHKEIDSRPINIGARRVRLTRLTLYNARPPPTSGVLTEPLSAPSTRSDEDDRTSEATTTPHILPQLHSCRPSSRSSSQESSPAFRRSMTPNIALPLVNVTTLSSIEQINLSNKPLEERVSKRKTHKCRGRSDSMAWFELRSLRRLGEVPPLSEMIGLSNADLFVNWIDIDLSICQIWKFVSVPVPNDTAPSHWVKMEWGTPSPEGGHRLIVTETGQPSFVAESTWRNKYRLQTAKIVH
ncbi:hypothetical protein CPB83DRAFT_840987 [Crepidotus variabilis]|uniref:Uncharacterized protein n=1 Tax=Crepidotus variabilis TaxID=179855 RepID=A0A9P6E3H4_9AGAR|nr:hypothetical protein CPB83DRAFT_840987 [Crepidotus variabilis]